MLLTLLACGTLTSARPLDPGQHVVGATFGGPAVDVGPATLPLPSLVLEGRSGVARPLDRPLEVQYGLNLTAVAFGMAQVHVGGAWLLLPQHGWIPAVALGTRLYAVDNHLDTSKVPEARAFYALDQVEILASWDGRRALGYLGLAQYTDLFDPSLLLTPVVGGQLHLGERWDVQVELRHYAINQRSLHSAFDWLTWGPGALGGNLAVSRRFGPLAPEAP